MAKQRETCNIADVARMNQVTPSAIREWLKIGKIPARCYFRAGGGSVDKLGRRRGKLVFYVDEMERLAKSWG